MSDLAPIFSDVAEVLRCEAVEGLKGENQKLKEELSQTRVVVSRVDLREEPKIERKVAEGYVEQMEAIALEDLPESYAKMLADRHDDGQFYALKLERTEAWVGHISSLYDNMYVVRLDKRDSSTILGVHSEGAITTFDGENCIENYVVDVFPEYPHTSVELKSTNMCFALEHLCSKIVACDNHDLWARCTQSYAESNDFDLAYGEWARNSSENSAEYVFDYLIFRRVERLTFLDDFNM